MGIIAGGKKGTYTVPEHKFDSLLDLAHTQDAFRGRIEDAVPVDFKHREEGEPVILDVVGLVPTVRLLRIRTGEGEYLDAILSIPTDKVEGHNLILLGKGRKDEERKEAGELVYHEDLRGHSPEEYFIGEGVSDAELVEFFKNVVEAIEDVKETHPSLVEKLERAISSGEPDPEAIRVAVEEYLREVNEGTPKNVLRLLYADLKALGLGGLKVGDLTLPKKRSVKEVVEDFLDGRETEGVSFVPLNAVVVGTTLSPESDVLIHFFPERVSLRSSRSIAKDLNSSYDYRHLNYLLSSVINPNAVIENERIREVVKGKIERKLKAIESREEANVYVSPAIKELYERAWKALDSANREEFLAVLEKAKTLLTEHLRENLSRNSLIDPGKLLVRKSGKRGFFLRDQLSNAGNTLRFWSQVSNEFEKGSPVKLALLPVPRIVNEDGQLQVKKVYKPYAYTTGGEWVFSRADTYHMAFDYPLYKIFNGIARAESWEEVRRLFSEGTPGVAGLEAFEEKVSQYKNVASVYQDVVSHVRGVFRELIYTPDDGDAEEKLAQAKALLREDPFIREFMDACRDFLLTRYYVKKVQEGEEEIALSDPDPEAIRQAEVITERIREAVFWSWNVGETRKRPATRYEKEEEVAPKTEERSVVEEAIETFDREMQEVEEEALGLLDDDFEIDWDEVSHQYDRARLRRMGGMGL